MAAGSIRERDGRFYLRTRVKVINSETGEREHVQANLKPGAAANYKGTFYRHVVPALGAVRVDECRPAMIKGLLVRKRGEGLSEETVAKIRRHLHAMFAFAQDTGLVSVNPASAPRRRGRRQRRRARGTALSAAEIERFLAECSPRWRLFFTVALDTGLRRGELVGLRWGDIDLAGRVLCVCRSIGNYDDPEDLDEEPERAGGDGELSTKTEAGERLVPILDSAYAALEDLRASAVDANASAPVFATVERKRGRDGVQRPVGRPLSPRMVSRVFRRYAERAGLPYSVRMHDLRHTAITSAIAQGEDIVLVAAFAGHAKTSTTVDVYSHLMPSRVRDAALRMRSIAPAAAKGTPEKLAS